MSAFLEYKLDPEFPFNIFEFVTRGDKDKLHWHNYLQIGLCIRGNGKFRFSNKEYPVTRGDVFICSNFESHVALSELPDSTTYIFAAFLPDLIASPGSRAFDFEYLSPFWYDIKTFYNKIDHLTVTAQLIGQRMVEMKKIWEDRGIGYKHLIDANLKQILGLLIRHYGTADPNYSAFKITNRIKMQPALNYIHQHFMKNITLEEVSSIVHMSESRFRHFFKEVTYIGFKEYITYLRINEAKKLLLTTDMSISEIGNNIGLSNIYQFYKQFEKYISMTPAKYRKYYRDNIVGEIISKVGYDVPPV
ncbi:MAG: AraC family transcriptional regulator [Firmicutes bacterium]|nr:AraC family transcriptional regulator [Bacillota bacterium]